MRNYFWPNLIYWINLVHQFGAMNHYISNLNTFLQKDSLVNSVLCSRSRLFKFTCSDAESVRIIRGLTEDTKKKI